MRPVRTVTIASQPPAPALAFTGHIEAQDRVDLSFRIGGRVAERNVGVGAAVREGDVVARLDPENELNDLRAARAALAAAEGHLREAEGQYQRQSQLLARNVATRADFEAAEQARLSARSQVTAARARVASAEDVVGFTTLKADAPGVVTRVGAEPGEVVAAGRMILQLARRDGRDAVFEAPADVVRSLHPGDAAAVALAGQTGVTAHGRVREISPQADPVTRTFTVRVGLSDPSPAFRLGAAITARIGGDGKAAIHIPATALMQRGNGNNLETGVWVVDPAAQTVSLRKVEVLASDPATAHIGKGLNPGDVVVTAGANVLREGQQVRLGGAETR
ncbi:efflux RND transporter periplasmic adaptor subunit [Camelimonas sp. ID_303_24]